jgi:RNA polymerase sigma-70 factor (ECF subfamily)
MSLENSTNLNSLGKQSLHDYLVVRSKEGDRRAQSELYLLYAKAMYNICRRIMGNEDDAKDVLQDAFIDAFLKINSLANEALFSAWIKKIVINKCINTIRKRKPELVKMEDFHDHFESESDSDFNNIEARRIMSVVDEISEGCRTVLNLYLFEGYDHSEIGQILGISESTSKAQYSKAKQKIRTILSMKQLENNG